MASEAMMPMSESVAPGAESTNDWRSVPSGSAVALGITLCTAGSRVPNEQSADSAFRNCFQSHMNIVTTDSYADAPFQVRRHRVICTNFGAGRAGRLPSRSPTTPTPVQTTARAFAPPMATTRRWPSPPTVTVSESSVAGGNRRGSCRTARGPIRWPRPWCGRWARGSRRTERRRGWRFSRWREPQPEGACAPLSQHGGGRATCLSGYSQLCDPREVSTLGRTNEARSREDPVSRRGNWGRRWDARSSVGPDRATSCSR